MTNRYFLHPATVFFLLTLLAAFLSWVGSIYGWEGIQSLLSAEGFRWQLRNSVPGFLHAPLLGHLLVLAFGAGLWMHSGLGAFGLRLLQKRGKCTRKEKRALGWSIVAGVICLFIGIVLAWGPWGVVRSITGGLRNSPLAEGFTSLLSVMVGMMAMVYGFAIDMYRTDRDLVRGLSYGFVYFSGYFITLFFVVQFFASLHYTGLDALLGISPVAFRICYTVCALGMLFFSGNKPARDRDNR